MSSKLLLSSVGDSEIINDATEQTIFTGTVPGGTLGTDGLLIVRIVSDILNTSGVGATARLKMKYGGTTIEDYTTISLASSANRYADLTSMFLSAQGSATIQRSMMEHRQGGANSATGGTAPGNDHNSGVNSSIAINSASDQTLAITVQLSAAHASLAYRRRGVWVEQWTPSIPTSESAGTQLLDFYVPNWNAGQGLVRNTTTETSVYSYTIPANTLGTGNLLIGQIVASCRNMSAANTQWWNNIYLGGGSIFANSAGTNNGADARRYTFPVEFWIGGAGATNAQRIGVNGHTIGGIAGSGEGNSSNLAWSANNSTNASAVDMTAPQVLEVKVDFSTATAEIDYRLESAVLMLVKA